MQDFFRLLFGLLDDSFLLQRVQPSDESQRLRIRLVTTHRFNQVDELGVRELHDSIVLRGHDRLVERLECTQVYLLHETPRVHLLQLAVHFCRADALVAAH